MPQPSTSHNYCNGILQTKLYGPEGRRPQFKVANSRGLNRISHTSPLDLTPGYGLYTGRERRFLWAKSLLVHWLKRRM